MSPPIKRIPNDERLAVQGKIGQSCIGRLATDHVVIDTPRVGPTPFRLSRLLDGSKVEVGAI